MKKWICALLLLALAAVCAFAAAEEEPSMSFVEEERCNYKPILTGSREELAVDTWLQAMDVTVSDEDYFRETDPDGPVFSFEQISGPATKAHIDDKNVLRMDSVQKKPCRITFRLTAEWAGVTAETNMYIEFYKCTMPKSIGFEDEYTLYAGEAVKLEVNYDNGKWPHRKWRGLYSQEVSSYDTLDVWAEEYPAGAGACTWIRGLQAGEATVLLEANQDGLNWYKTVKIKVVDYKDKQGNTYFLNGNGTASLTAGKKNAASVTVPATIQAGEKTYKVTEIAGKAFSGNKKLTKLIIGKNVTQIGAKACYGCKKLAQITIKAKKLQTGSLGKNAFKGIANKAVVKCPTKALAKAYKKLLTAAGAPKDIVCR